jgi:uncharacterized membrane protein YozB (DUF420 family)
MIYPIVLHAGMSPIISETVLMLMLVALGLSLVGIGFGRVKSKEGLMQHRWTMSAAIIINLVAVVLVMLPTFFRYYTDPDVMVFSSLSLTTIIHGITGVPAVLTGLVYAFGKLPEKPKSWMRVTAFLWIANIVIGLVLFLQMLEVI